MCAVEHQRELTDAVTVCAGQARCSATQSTTLIVVGVVGCCVYPLILDLIYQIGAVTCCRTPRKLTPVVLKAGQLPLLYSPKYNITACGIERMHPFDSTKYGRVHSLLLDVVDESRFVDPGMLSRAELLDVHPWRYLVSLLYSLKLTAIMEVPVCCLPAPILAWRVLHPMMAATKGSMSMYERADLRVCTCHLSLMWCGGERAVAAELALTHGWAINLSGGYHHASANSGGGFCAFADITLAIRHARRMNPRCQRVLIVDLDAHQGNGHERDFMHDSDTFILDAYNPSIYPGDTYAKQAIRATIHFRPTDPGEWFLQQLDSTLSDAIATHQPDLVVYNAGTDCLEGDPLGGLSLTEDAIVARDETVFRHCLAGTPQVPVCMFFSGGYQRRNAPVIARSILNLNDKFGLFEGSPRARAST